MFVPSTERAFLAKPIGRCVIGRAFLVGCAEKLRVCAMWGKPDAADVGQLNRLLAAVLQPGLATPIAALTDTTRVREIDAAGFDLLKRFTSMRAAEFARVIGKQALVRAPVEGLVASAAAGFYETGDKTFPVRVFTDSAAALRWLGRRDGAGEAAALAALIESEVASTEAVARLRAFLDGHLDASLDGACATLGITARTLRRRLDESGTSFRREVEAARVRTAQHLLGDSALKIVEVAERAGFSSPQRLSAALRRVTGLTPKEFRRR
jgi:AraC-like DNA-binding protein